MKGAIGHLSQENRHREGGGSPCPADWGARTGLVLPGGGAYSHALHPLSDWSLRNRRRPTAANPDAAADPAAAAAVGWGCVGPAQIEPRCRPARRSDSPAPGRVSTSLFAFSVSRELLRAFLRRPGPSPRARGAPRAQWRRRYTRGPGRSAIGPPREPRGLIGPWGSRWSCACLRLSPRCERGVTGVQGRETAGAGVSWGWGTEPLPLCFRIRKEIRAWSQFWVSWGHLLSPSA